MLAFLIFLHWPWEESLNFLPYLGWHLLRIFWLLISATLLLYSVLLQYSSIGTHGVVSCCLNCRPISLHSLDHFHILAISLSFGMTVNHNTLPALWLQASAHDPGLANHGAPYPCPQGWFQLWGSWFKECCQGPPSLPHGGKVYLVEENETNTQREALKADIEIESSNEELSTEIVSFSASFQSCLWIHLSLQVRRDEQICFLFF